MPIVLYRGKKYFRQNGLQFDVDRYWDYVVPSTDPSMCWEWSGSKMSHGYASMPALSYNAATGKWVSHSTTAHRCAYALANGHWPVHEGGHLCSNRGCQNPAHIEDQTHQENMHQREIDAALTGQYTGRPGHIGIFQESLIEVLYQQGFTQQEIADYIGRTQARVSLHLSGKYRRYACHV